MVYRFKVTYEDHEDIFRYIEIKSSQSFLELHIAIQQAVGFDNSKSAVFYMSDDYWRKEKEISVENTGEEKNQKSNIKNIAGEAEKKIKKKKTIADYIDNPHQRFLYIFDPEKEWTFLLELLKIVPEDKTASYPQCSKSVGVAPKQYKIITPIPIADEEDETKNELSAKKEEPEPASIMLENDSLDEETEGFIPLNEEGIEELADDEVKELSEDSEDGEELNEDIDTGEMNSDKNESLD